MDPSETSIATSAAIKRETSNNFAFPSLKHTHKSEWKNDFFIAREFQTSYYLPILPFKSTFLWDALMHPRET